VNGNGKGWATVAFLLGIGVSVAANVAHTWYPPADVLRASGKTLETWRPEVGAQLVAAFFPLALLLTVEILARVPWPGSFGWAAARYGGTAMVALVAAVVSYRHMAGLLHAYGEDGLTASIAPLAVDGLMLVASVALLAISRAAGAPERTINRDFLSSGRTAEAPHVIAERATVPATRNGRVRAPRPIPAPADPDVNAAAAEVFAAEVSAGRVPSIADIKTRLRVGQRKATTAQAYLRTLAAEN
jgi:hypothetical protein